ncbi:MAG TPA: magnesium and cobalt transport protein CorA [Actinomycetes bacterium]|nr:magnesium and cobalt transport protein CorA [Actinomycetes bacterium]
MIVDCAVYQDGQRKEIEPERLEDEIKHAREHPGEFVWIGLYEPSPAELERVAAEFDLHPLAVEDALEAHQRPKLEVYGESLFLVLKTLAPGSPDLEIGEIMVFLGGAFVVTVRYGTPDPLPGVRHRLEAGHHKLLAAGTAGVLYAIADTVVDTYSDIVAELDTEIDELEARVFAPERTDDAREIYQLKRRVVQVRRTVVPLIEPTHELAAGQIPDIDATALPFFRDIADHVRRAADLTESADSLLTAILQANLARVSVLQNEDTRRISAWVAIAAVPTVVAGIYGMNFEHMPELRWRYGYPAVILLLVVACTTLYRLFKRSGWL